MNLNVALAEGSVEPAEIEGADLALQGLPQLLRPRDLASPEIAVTFAMEGPSGEEAAFNRRVSLIIEFIWIFWDLVQLTCADTLPQSSGSPKHLGGPGDEGGDDLLIQPTALGRAAGVCGVVRGKIGSLAADAADGSELRDGLRCVGVDGQGPEQVGEIEYARVAFTEFIPPVLDHECAGQQQLVAGPCRASRHGPYRMSVRCHVWGGRSGKMCDAHLRTVVLSVGSVTLCDDWWQSVPVGQVWKEGA